MAADYHAHVYQLPGARHALLRGVPRKLLAELNVSALWSPQRRGFLVRSEAMADIVALLEWQHVAVRHHTSEPKR